MKFNNGPQVWAFMTGMTVMLGLYVFWTFPDLRVRGDISLTIEMLAEFGAMLFTSICGFCWYVANYNSR